MNQQRAQQQHKKRDHAALRPRRTSRQPLRTLHGSVQVAAHTQQAAVRRAVEKGFRPIPRRVESQSEPQRARPPDHQAKKQTDHYDLQNAENIFIRIAEMRGSEYQRRKQRGTPELEAPREREQPVAAKSKFFSSSPPVNKRGTTSRCSVSVFKMAWND